MRPQPAGVDHQHARPLAVTHGLHDAVNRLAEVGTRIIQAPRAQAEGGAAALDRAAQGVAGVGGLGNAVVLDHEEHGRLPDRGQVHALVQQAFAEGAVAHHDGHHAAATLLAPMQRQSGANGCHARLYAVTVEVAKGHVLAAAIAAADAGFAPHDLGNQAHEVTCISHEMAMVAVVGQHHVVRFLHGAHNGHLAELLTQAGVGSARQQALAEQIEDQLFGDAQQVAIGVQTGLVEADERFAVGVALKAGEGTQRSGWCVVCHGLREYAKARYRKHRSDATHRRFGWPARQYITNAIPLAKGLALHFSARWGDRLDVEFTYHLNELGQLDVRSHIAARLYCACRRSSASGAGACCRCGIS